MRKKYRAVLYGLVFLTVAAVYSIQKSKPAEHSVTLTDCLDTVCEITAVSSDGRVVDKCAEYIRKISDELSPANENGALYRYNNGEDAEFSEDAEELISRAESFTRENPECFSVYLNPLIQEWDIKNNTGRIPENVEALLKEVQKEKTLNLGAAAKGFITDKIADMLRSENVSSALINLGGNVYAVGRKPTGENWKIGIQNPKNEDEIVGVITAENLAVVTSGDYMRCFEKDGVRYHHILDPKTGFPASGGLHSVTVVSENALLADMLATAVFVAGAEQGAELLKKYDVMGILITDDTVYFSKSLENIFRQSDFSYKYEFI